MSVSVAHLRLVRRFGKKHPSVLKVIARDLTTTTLDEALRAQRDNLFVRFLKARGDRNLTFARAPKRFVESLERADGVNDLISDMHHPVLRGLCAIWLAQQTSVVGHVEAVFEVSDETEIEPPTFDEIEAALGRFNSKGIAATRTAVFALLCTRRLGDVGDATDEVVDGDPPIAGSGAQATATTVGASDDELEDQIPEEEADPVETPATRRAEGKSATLATLLKALKAMAPDDPAWDEFDDWIEDLRDCADEAAAARARLREESALRERLARWSGEFAEVAKAFTHPIPTWEQLRGLSLIEVATRIDALFEVYALFVALNARPHKGLDELLALGNEIAAIKPRIEGAFDEVMRLLPAGTPASSPPQASPASAVTAPSPFDVPVPPAPTAPTQVSKPAKTAAAPAVAPIATAAPPAQVATRATAVASSASLLGLKRPASQRAKDVVLCLDFGTARSKAMAVRADGTPVFLPTGAVTRSKLKESIASSVWIDMMDEVMIFGDTAVERSLAQGKLKQPRIDSLKDFLSASMTSDSALPNPDVQPLPKGVDPSGKGFTIGEVLVLYLGYLVWAAEEALRVSGVTSDVPRRFAIPCWAQTHRKAGIELLRTYLARATLLARHVGRVWLNGLPLGEAKELARAALEVPVGDLPLDLYVEGITEPLAAVGTRNEELSHRNGLVLVADIGAGTSDFGLYLVSDPNAEPRFIEVATHSINRAGNHIDEILRRFIVRDLYSGAQGSASATADMELQLRQRSIKEELFTRKKTRVTLQAGPQFMLDLDTFRREPEVKAFESDLRKAFCDTFAAAEKALASSGEGVDWSRYLNLRVVLTGGGALLPMVRDLAGYSFQPFRNPGFETARVVITSTPTASLPQPVRRYGVTEEAYLPLAVAWGGAMPVLPVQGKPVGLATVRCPGIRLSVVDALVPPAEPAWR
jgi:hypothetical protein